MGLLNPHLDDNDFADVWSARLTLGRAESDRPAEDHLRACSDCRGRFDSFTSWLEKIRIDGRTEAEAAFTADRLVGQQTQILRRLEALEHPGRVIAFPKFAAPVSVQPNGRRRWVAIAATVGLITGVGLGQFLEFRKVSSQPDTFVQQRQAPRTPGDTPRVLQPVSTSQLSDETFLIEPELTSSQVLVPESLKYLNDITPGARDSDR